MTLKNHEIINFCLFNLLNLGEFAVYQQITKTGTYPVRTQAQSSPASHHDTGISEPPQGAPTPPGRSTRTRPRRSHSPAMMGTVEPTGNRTPQSICSHTQPLVPLLPASQLRGDTKPLITMSSPEQNQSGGQTDNL